MFRLDPGATQVFADNAGPYMRKDLAVVNAVAAEMGIDLGLLGAVANAAKVATEQVSFVPAVVQTDFDPNAKWDADRLQEHLVLTEQLTAAVAAKKAADFVLAGLNGVLKEHSACAVGHARRARLHRQRPLGLPPRGRRGDEGRLRLEAHQIGNAQPHVPVNARARIPARRRLRRRPR